MGLEAVPGQAIDCRVLASSTSTATAAGGGSLIAPNVVMSAAHVSKRFGRDPTTGRAARPCRCARCSWPQRALVSGHVADVVAELAGPPDLGTARCACCAVHLQLRWVQPHPQVHHYWRHLVERHHGSDGQSEGEAKPPCLQVACTVFVLADCARHLISHRARPGWLWGSGVGRRRCCSSHSALCHLCLPSLPRAAGPCAPVLSPVHRVHRRPLGRGAYDANSTLSTPRAARAALPLQKMYRHPGYSDLTLENDVVLFELEQPVEGIRPAKLAKKNLVRPSPLL